MLWTSIYLYNGLLSPNLLHLLINRQHSATSSTVARDHKHSPFLNKIAKNHRQGPGMRLSYLIATAFAVIVVSAKPEENTHEAKDKGKGPADNPESNDSSMSDSYDIEVPLAEKIELDKLPKIFTHPRSRRSSRSSSRAAAQKAVDEGKDNADDVDSWEQVGGRWMGLGDGPSSSQANAIQEQAWEKYQEEVGRAQQELGQRFSSQNLSPANGSWENIPYSGRYQHSEDESPDTVFRASPGDQSTSSQGGEPAGPSDPGSHSDDNQGSHRDQKHPTAAAALHQLSATPVSTSTSLASPFDGTPTATLPPSSPIATPSDCYGYDSDGDLPRHERYGDDTPRYQDEIEKRRKQARHDFSDESSSDRSRYGRPAGPSRREVGFNAPGRGQGPVSNFLGPREMTAPEGSGQANERKLGTNDTMTRIARRTEEIEAKSKDAKDNHSDTASTASYETTSSYGTFSRFVTPSSPNRGETFPGSASSQRSGSSSEGRSNQSKNRASPLSQNPEVPYIPQTPVQDVSYPASGYSLSGNADSISAEGYPSPINQGNSIANYYPDDTHGQSSSDGHSPYSQFSYHPTTTPSSILSLSTQIPPTPTPSGYRDYEDDDYDGDYKKDERARRASSRNRDREEERRARQRDRDERNRQEELEREEESKKKKDKGKGKEVAQVAVNNTGSDKPRDRINSLWNKGWVRNEPRDSEDYKDNEYEQQLNPATGKPRWILSRGDGVDQEEVDMGRRFTAAYQEKLLERLDEALNKTLDTIALDTEIQRNSGILTCPSTPSTAIYNRPGDQTPSGLSVIHRPLSSDNSSTRTERRTPIICPEPPVQKPKKKAVAGHPPRPPPYQALADEHPRHQDQGNHFAEYQGSSSRGRQAPTLTLRLGTTPSPRPPTPTLRLATMTPSNSRRSPHERATATLTLRLGTPAQFILDARSTATLTLTLFAAAVPSAVPDAASLPFSAPASGGYAEREDRASVLNSAAGGNYRRLLVFRAGGSPL